MTGFTAAKILWVQAHEPELWARVRHILLPKDYVRYVLTGEFATDASDAAGTQLFDVSGRQWNAELCKAANVDMKLLPTVFEGVEVTGKVSRAAAELTGLAAGTPVVGGGADNASAAVGCGVIAEGNAFLTLGSSAVILAVSDEPLVDTLGRVHSLCAAVEKKWTLMSCTQAAGLSLKWLARILNGVSAEQPGYGELDKLAEIIPPGSERLLYLPYLMGERSPHPDANARGAFVGLSAVHECGHLIRAVLEGVAFSQLECLEVFRGMGINVSEIVVTGGGARSPLWRRILADVLNVPLRTLKADEGAALGAAQLAALSQGSGYWAVELGEVTKPDLERHEAYAPFFELYKSLYVALKDSYKALAKTANMIN
jgi:xylulokinase